eukprot:TRINITY_DN83952_c0_g1_i1.p1 TRINITY_DN83952_c0_g1~~TRINITY_DN83952_c0_g1_i1.p1  ORF type:complete len:515 (+),score=79.13 TRINITY_DN83952_c0_g1_i1:68-1612(+)
MTTKGKKMRGTDPFAAFLAARPATLRKEALKTTQDSEGTVVFAGDEPLTASACDLDTSAYASFLNLRPPKRAPTPPEPEPTLEDRLRQELYKTKNQLLEVAIQAERNVLSGMIEKNLNGETVEVEDESKMELDERERLRRSRRVKKAQKYLEHPERIGQEFSDSEAEDEAMKKVEVATQCSGSDSRRNSKMDRQFGSSASGIKASTYSAFGNYGQSGLGFAAGRSSKMAMSMSTPNLSSIGGTTKLPPIHSDPVGVPISPMSTMCESPINAANDPFMKCWWSKTRCWNAKIGKKDLRAARQSLPLPGGCVVLGNGKVPLTSGSHLLTTGYYFAFQIDQIDEDNFPLDNVKDMTIGFGVSHLPARHKACDKPVYGYEVPGTILVGYGQHLIDHGAWFRQDHWDSKDLKVGDVVGCQIAPDGALVVWVNGEQVLRVSTSLGDPNASPSKKIRISPRRVLFPMVDLHGRVSAVTLLPKAALPNLPLRAKNPIVETAESFRKRQAAWERQMEEEDSFM